MTFDTLRRTCRSFEINVRSSKQNEIIIKTLPGFIIPSFDQ